MDDDVTVASSWAGGGVYASCESLDGSRGGKVNAPASSDEAELKRRGSIWLTCMFYRQPWSAKMESIEGENDPYRYRI